MLKTMVRRKEGYGRAGIRLCDNQAKKEISSECNNRREILT